jgi:hypothetical protein
MEALLEPLEAADDQWRYFHATHLRTTIAVAGELKRFIVDRVTNDVIRASCPGSQITPAASPL